MAEWKGIRPLGDWEVRGLLPAFPKLNHTSDLTIGTLVSAPPGMKGSVLGQVGPASVCYVLLRGLIFRFCLSVAAQAIVCAGPTLGYSYMLLGRQATLKQTMISLAGNADTAPTTASATIYTQGRPSFVKLAIGHLCKGWPPLYMHGGACSGWGNIEGFQPEMVYLYNDIEGFQPEWCISTIYHA